MTAVETSAPGRDPLDVAAREELRDLFMVEDLHRRGPASMVYVARDVRDNQPVALKVMPRSPSAGAAAEDAFQRAVAAVGALRHVHIVRLRRAGVTRRFFWYAMEYVQGPSFADLLNETGPMDLLPCLRVVEQVASALDYAHRRGVVHANLKPANVLLDGVGWARVADFSIPRVLEGLGALSAPGGASLLQPRYIAPEESSARRPDAQADQYALATLIYESLSGTFPAAVLDGGRPPLLCDANPRIPRHAAVAVQRALSATPGARFTSVVEFVASLQAPAAPPRPVTRGARVAPRAAPSRAPPASPVVLFPIVEEEPVVSRKRWVVLGALTLAVASAVVVVALPGSGRNAAGTIARRPLPVALVPADSVAKFPDAAEPARVDTGGVTAGAPPSRDAGINAPPPPRRAIPARPGHLFINATPWGRIYVNGVLVGNTPKGAIPVTPGTHRVRIVRDGYAPFERTVSVVSDQNLRLTDVVLVELQP